MCGARRPGSEEAVEADLREWHALAHHQQVLDGLDHRRRPGEVEVEAVEVEHLFSLSPGHTDTGDPEARAGIDNQGQLTALGPAPDDDLCERMLASGVPLEALERQLLEYAVAHERGNLSAAARRLGLTRPQLAYRLRRGPPPPDAQGES